MSRFHRDFARLLLEICRYTYAAALDSGTDTVDKQDALNGMKQAGIPQDLVMLKDDKKVSTSAACVAAYPDKNIVSYMGTKTEFSTPEDALESTEDWMQNLELLLVPFKLSAEQLGLNHPDKGNLGGLVHGGFLEELGGVQAKVVEELLKRGGKDRPLYVTGHSQGGAEAALATRAFLAGGFDVAATYTFAAARPGDLAFAQSIPSTLPFHRIEFGDDIVPHVPPTRMRAIARLTLWGLPKVTSLPERQKKLLLMIARAAQNTGFVGSGRLCYGNNETKTLEVDLSAEEDAALFYPRLWSLIRHPKNWAEHHHLVGTAEDVKAGRKGNYTTLVSEFPIAS